MIINCDHAAATSLSTTIHSEDVVAVEWVKGQQRVWFHLRDGSYVLIQGWKLKEIREVAKALGRRVRMVNNYPSADVASGPAGYAVAAVLESVRKENGQQH